MDMKATINKHTTGTGTETDSNTTINKFSSSSCSNCATSNNSSRCSIISSNSSSLLFYIQVKLWLLLGNGCRRTRHLTGLLPLARCCRVMVALGLQGSGSGCTMQYLPLRQMGSNRILH